MNKISHLIITLFIAGSTQSQTTVNGSFVHGGITRTYSYYVPASYNPSQPLPLIIGLHGTSSSGSQFAQYRDFRPIADTANFIMAHPDGSTMFGIKFWNFGNVMGSTVDDVGFLEALIDTISSHYAVNQNRIYSVGMSNGGFMTYYLACQSNRFAAIGSVTGSMSNDTYNNCNAQHPTPSIHIHGTADPTNPYNGNSTSKSIPLVTRFWVNQNGCDTIPSITSVPNINTTDGATAERHLYSNGINGNTVEHFKVTGGEHTWPGCPMPSSSDVTCMDFDARFEIWRFFRQYTLNSSTNIQSLNKPSLSVWPNPTTNFLNLELPSHVISKVSVFDIHGRIVKVFTEENIKSISLQSLNQGVYSLQVSGKDFSYTQKIILTCNN